MFAPNFVAADDDTLDIALIDPVEKLAERDRLARPFRLLEKAPQQEHQNDDDDPEERRFNRRIQ